MTADERPDRRAAEPTRPEPTAPRRRARPGPRADRGAAAALDPGRSGRSKRGPAPSRRTDAPRSSGAHPDDRDPQLLDATVGRLVEEHGWEVDLRVHGVFGRWDELVGAEVAAHCTPGALRRRPAGRPHRLDRVGDPAAAAGADRRAPAQRGARRRHGDRIEVRGPQRPSWKQGRRSVRDGRGPRDTYG